MRDREPYTVLVRYTQKFWGETLTDSYTREVYSQRDVENIYKALYEDPCVKHVEVTKIEKIVED